MLNSPLYEPKSPDLSYRFLVAANAGETVISHCFHGKVSVVSLRNSCTETDLSFPLFNGIV